jgi:EAL domain-containing protein (putative c-di-GMP-specific phosphodiesterase class I)
MESSMDLVILMLVELLIAYFIFRKKIVRMVNIKRLLDNNQLYCVYQPIVDLKTGNTYGYESLSRTNNDKYNNIKEVIDEIYKFKFVNKFILLAVQNSVNSFKKFEIKDKNLFINIDPEFFKQNTDEVFNLLQKIDPDIRKNIVLELTENVPIDDMKKLYNSCEKARNFGVKLAIDDYGSGYSNNNLLISVPSHYVKIDMNFIRDIDKCINKKELVRNMVEFSRFIGAKTICEGIETKEELDVLTNLGADYGQGYYLGKPREILS